MRRVAIHQLPVSFAAVAMPFGKTQIVGEAQRKLHVASDVDAVIDSCRTFKYTYVPKQHGVSCHCHVMPQLHESRWHGRGGGRG